MRKKISKNPKFKEIENKLSETGKKLRRTISAKKLEKQSRQNPCQIVITQTNKSGT